MAKLPHIEIRLNVRSLFERKIDLAELILSNPEFHIIIDPQARANLPTTVAQATNPQNFEIAIASFRIVHGSTVVNEHQIDTDFLVHNLESAMSFHSTTGILNGNLRYDGEYNRSEGAPLPYTFDAEIDFTRGTLLPHRISLQSGASALQLQGRIDNVLNNRITGHLEYSGNVQVTFLHYFFPDEEFTGSSAVAGSLDFSDGHFATTGNATADSITYDGWQAKALRTQYSYAYPQKHAVFKNIETNLIGGKASGTVTVENLPGPARVLLDVNYAGIDGLGAAAVVSLGSEVSP